MTPAVSVVMPARDAAPHIGAAVASVLAQTHGDLEIVVVDDESHDATASIARSFADPRVRVVPGPGRGVAAARNVGIRAATAPIIAFCDADDILLPSHLAALLEVLGGAEAIATANAFWLFEGGVDPGKRRHPGRLPALRHQRRTILEQNFVSTMAAFPRSVFERVGPFDEQLRHAEDWEFWMRAVFAGVPVLHQPRPLALYRWGHGLSADRDAMDAAVTEVLARARRLGLTPSEAAYVERRLSSPSPQALTRTADEHLRAGRWRDAAASYRQASGLVPSERPLARKAALLRLPWLGGPVLRRQMEAADRRRGTREGRQR